jgi:hypothetical protein
MSLFSLKDLERRVHMHIVDFAEEIPEVMCADVDEKENHWSLGDRYFFRDNGSNVLAVAHLDVVMWKEWFGHFAMDDGLHVFTPHLDDRLGVYVIMDLLPKMGIVPDILLATGEENGGSTAGKFKTDKKYNWLVEFDRRGEDVVLYKYDNVEWRATLREAGFTPSYGSNSDINHLNLGVKGMNIGVGYEREHTELCNASIPMMMRQVDRFAAFYEANKDVEYVHVPAPAVSYGTGYGSSYLPVSGHTCSVCNTWKWRSQYSFEGWLDYVCFSCEAKERGETIPMEEAHAQRMCLTCRGWKFRSAYTKEGWKTSTCYECEKAKLKGKDSTVVKIQCNWCGKWMSKKHFTRAGWEEGICKRCDKKFPPDPNGAKIVCKQCKKLTPISWFTEQGLIEQVCAICENKNADAEGIVVMCKECEQYLPEGDFSVAGFPLGICKQCEDKKNNQCRKCHRMLIGTHERSAHLCEFCEKGVKTVFVYNSSGEEVCSKCSNPLTMYEIRWETGLCDNCYETGFDVSAISD